ncbi:sulfotransferase domain-containing protein [Kaistia defluvii]|uniref:sulfotransferase domain-containing protein n=1 Tax=Kaistia defluvii TaxID=410841 RepID=UPI0033910810
MASYPRSGNHLFRTVLKRSFDLGSYTAYQPANGKAGKLTEVVGELRFDEETFDDFLEKARASPDLFLIKTHDFVPETDSCIYIVRDARASLFSYRRFLADFEEQQLSFDDLIVGKAWPGAWQDHVKAFVGRDPMNTLVLRYEELASNAPPLERIGAFLRVAPVRPFDVSFSDLRALNERLFRTGDNGAGIASIERHHHETFWAHCGEMMRALGYRDKDGGMTLQQPITLPLPTAQRDNGPYLRGLARRFTGL